MNARDRGRGRGARDSGGARSSRTGRAPADVLAQQMGEAKLARLSQDWAAYEHARDTAIHLVLGHRIEDEVSRFRQVMTACTGRQNTGQHARELIVKGLTGAFVQGVDGRESAQELLVRMQRIPRTQATVALVREMRRGDGEICIELLFSKDGHLEGTWSDDAAQIAARFTDRDWANFAAPVLQIAPGAQREDVMEPAGRSLRSTLSAIAFR